MRSPQLSMIRLVVFFGLMGTLLGATSRFGGDEQHQRDSDDDRDAPYPNDWFIAQRAFPASDIDQKVRLSAFADAAKLVRSTASVGDAWTFLGPDNVGGRITAVASPLGHPERIFVGTANGGVFRSMDSGTTWNPVFGDQASLSIGAIAIDPSNASRIWVGTGEANSSGSTYPGTGIYRSDDGGATWNHMGLLASHHIGRITVAPNDSSTVFVAALGNLFAASAERGVYVTHDGGTTWALSLHTTDLAGAVDVAVDPQHPQVVYAALWHRLHQADHFISGGPGSGVYRSTDGGVHWQQVTAGLPVSGDTTGRIGLAVSPTKSGVVYVVYDDTATHFNGVYRSDDSATTFTRTNDGALANMFATYGWWYGNIRVDPTNPDVVFVVGFTAFRSLDGGNSWQDIGSSVHADMHDLAIDPASPEHLLLADDGGLFTSVDRGATWSGPATLPNTQFYSVAVDPKSSGRVYGGAQDNGTVATFTGQTSDWTAVYGGDGFQVQIDPVDASVAYAEYQNGALARSTDGGRTFSTIGPTVERANWNTPIILDPNDHKTLFYGANKLWKSTDGGDTWAAVSPDLSVGARRPQDTLVLGTITAIAVAKANSQIIYCGTDGGRLWLTKNGGSTWSAVNATLPERWVTSLAVDPVNAGRLVVTLSGYRTSDRLSHVYASDDFGTTWKAIDGGLPEVPVNVVRLDPTRRQMLYVGTDAGVYVTSDFGAHWSPLGTGLPLAPVMDLAIDSVGSRIVAATFGRSMWAISLP